MGLRSDVNSNTFSTKGVFWVQLLLLVFVRWGDAAVEALKLKSETDINKQVELTLCQFCLVLVVPAQAV